MAVPLILLVIALCLYAYLVNRIFWGTAADYWEKACGIELADYEGDKHFNFGSGTYPERGGSFIYYIQNEHQRATYAVKRESVAALLPSVVANLVTPVRSSKNRVCATSNGDFCPREIERKNRKRVNCLSTFEQSKRDPMAFLDQMAVVTTSPFENSRAEQNGPR